MPCYRHVICESTAGSNGGVSRDKKVTTRSVFNVQAELNEQQQRNLGPLFSALGEIASLRSLPYTLGGHMCPENTAYTIKWPKRSPTGIGKARPARNRLRRPQVHGGRRNFASVVMRLAPPGVRKEEWMIHRPFGSCASRGVLRGGHIITAVRRSLTYRLQHF